MSAVVETQFNAAAYNGNNHVHRVVRSIATRFGRRYVAACGAHFYAVNICSLDREVTCRRCLVKTGV